MLTIRQVEADDLGEIIDIETACFSAQEAASPKAMQERIQYLADTFLVATLDNRLVGYCVGPVKEGRYLEDDIFDQVTPNSDKGGFIQLQSLAVAPNFQGQGIGMALLAAMKDLAVAQERRGITLTCHFDLIGYYEFNGFQDEGESPSQHGGSQWFNMVWEN